MISESISNKLIRFSLIISLLIHLVVIVIFSTVKIKSVPKPFKTIEVTYSEIKVKEIKKEKMQGSEARLIKEAKLPKNVEIFSDRPESFTTVGKKIRDMTKLTGKFNARIKQTPAIKTLDMHRKITIPLLKSVKISNPRYLSYNQSIRQRIRQRAYHYIDHPDFQSGQVYLTFVLASDGTLTQIKVIENKTSANSYLRTVGLRSIKDSNPFSAFPKELQYPELTFNVIISFEIK